MEILNASSDQSLLQKLQHAFEQFNQLSAQLNASVDQINENVDRVSPLARQSIVDQSIIDQSTINNMQLLDAIPGGVVVLDRHGTVIKANLTALEWLGEPVYRQAWRDVVSRVFLSELDQGELKTIDGHQYSLSTRPLGYAPGQVLLLSDVTQTRELQRTAQQNLHLVTMGKMMASLAHQIRTPLASSMLYLSQCVEGSIDTKTRQSFCNKALSRNRHIEKLINDMLVFAHGGQFVTTRFSVRALIDELQEQLMPQLLQRHCNLQLDGQDSDAELQGNKDALLGALANICMNALQAATNQARIQIRIEKTIHGLLAISIKDNGVGMGKEVLRHIFDPFYSTKADGSGLGLAVVKAVIESHQGRIAVFSKLGRGTRFRIFLPCRQAMTSQISQNSTN